MTDKKTSDQPRQRPADLLPNEEEISYEHVHNYFNRNKTWIAALSVMILLFVGWVFFSRQQENAARQEANTKLARAQSTHNTEALASVAHDYPGTDAGTIATMMIADAFFQQRQWDKAFGFYQLVASQSPPSALAPSAFIGMAAIAEATGKTPEAIKSYQLVASTFPDSFQAAQAQFAVARLLEGDGQLVEARKAYEDLVTRHPASAWRTEAEEHLERVTDILKTKSPDPKT